MDNKTIELTSEVLQALGSGVADLRKGDPDNIEAAERVVAVMDEKGYRYSGYNFWPKDPNKVDEPTYGVWSVNGQCFAYKSLRLYATKNREEAEQYAAWLNAEFNFETFEVRIKEY